MVWRVPNVAGLLAWWKTSVLRDRDNCFNNAAQCPALVPFLLKVRHPGFKLYFCWNILNIFDQSQSSGLGEALIHSTDFPAENTIDGHTQGGGFTVHRPSATDDQVRIPDQIQAVHSLCGNDDVFLLNSFGPLRAKEVCLRLVARKQYNPSPGLFQQKLQAFVKKEFAFGIVIVRFRSGRTEYNQYFVLSDSQLISQAGV